MNLDMLRRCTPACLCDSKQLLRPAVASIVPTFRNKSVQIQPRFVASSREYDVLSGPMIRRTRQTLLRLVPTSWPRCLTVLFLVLVVALLVHLGLPLPSVNTFCTGLALVVGFVVGRAMHSTGSARSARLKPDSGQSVPLAHHDLQESYNSFSASLVQFADRSDEILKEAAMLKLAAIQDELQSLVAGRIVFSDTEAWRTTYETILRTPGLKRYFSVARLRNEDYWRNAPGQHSMRLNYELARSGVRIERTLILNDFFWPPATALPAKDISRWIGEQAKYGLIMRLVRESELDEERELLGDIGIYGDRACGLLELDELCQTIRFTLDFSEQTRRRFEDRWRRLLLFAVPFQQRLDQKSHRD